MLIAGATTAVVAPQLVPIALIGSTAPDWLEWVLKATGNPVKHRTVTHWVIGWIIGLIFCAAIWDVGGIGAAFFYGGLTHVLADSLTVTGVPFSPWSDRRFHLFGGRLRTGDPAEYGISAGVVVVCAALFTILGVSGFYPFFYNWQELYNAGVMDGSEWRANRLKFF